MDWHGFASGSFTAGPRHFQELGQFLTCTRAFKHPTTHGQGYSVHVAHGAELISWWISCLWICFGALCALSLNVGHFRSYWDVCGWKYIDSEDACMAHLSFWLLLHVFVFSIVFFQSYWFQSPVSIIIWCVCWAGWPDYFKLQSGLLFFVLLNHVSADW